MENESIAAAHERMAEQLQSDEHILGALPDDASGVLLHWALARLDAAAAGATDLAALEAAFDEVRADARAAADGAAERGEDAESLAARLGTGEAPGAPPLTPEPVWDEQPPFTPAEAAEPQTSEPPIPAGLPEEPSAEPIAPAPAEELPAEAPTPEPPAPQPAAIPEDGEERAEEPSVTQPAEPVEPEQPTQERGFGGFWRRMRRFFGGGGEG